MNFKHLQIDSLNVSKINKLFKTKFLILIAYSFFLIMPVHATLYDDAEQYGVKSSIHKSTRTANGWYVYDSTPTGAVVNSVYDAIKQSHVIQFVGQVGSTANGYVIGDWTPTSPGSWNNTSELNVNWCSRYANYFTVFMRIYVTNPITFTNRNGNTVTTYQRYLTYRPVNTDHGINSTYPNYIYLGLGSDKSNDQWHSIQRNMLADLQKFEPGNTITSVTAFLVRGNGKVDDIELTAQSKQPAITLKKTSKTIFDPINYHTHPKAIPGAVLEYTITANNSSNGAADNNSIKVDDKIPTNMKLCVSSTSQCVAPNLSSTNNTSGLILTSIQYSNNNGATYTYNPVADTGGFDALVTNVKYIFNKRFLGSCGLDRSIELKMRMGVK